MLHLVLFISRLGDFAGYKILAINSYSRKMVTAADHVTVNASDHVTINAADHVTINTVDHVTITAAATIAPPRPNVCALDGYEALTQSFTARTGSLRARVLASIVGRIIAMGLGIGPITRFMTRSMYTLLESRASWNCFLRLTPEAQREIKFWIEGLRQYNSQPIWYTPSSIRVVYTDASESGYGGYIVEHGCHVAMGQWSEEDEVKSSTWRELMAVLLVLESFSTKLRNQRVRWFTDNQNVV